MGGGHAAKAAAREAAPWIRWLARLGYAAKGVVYTIIGVLALKTAVSSAPDRPEGSSGALRAILEQPMGRVLLGVVAVGLVGYVLWRAVQALLDPEHKGSDLKGIARRIGFAISGVLYGAVAYQAVVLMGWAGSGGGGSGGGGDTRAEDWTATVMQVPLGRWAVGLTGVGVILFGLFELYRGWKQDVVKHLNLSGADPEVRRNVERLGRAGMLARGVVFLVMGWFLVRAALEYDPQEAHGLAESLAALQGETYGPWLLGGVAVGLIAYGLFQLAKARYRVIRTPG